MTIFPGRDWVLSEANARDQGRNRPPVRDDTCTAHPSRLIQVGLLHDFYSYDVLTARHALRLPPEKSPRLFVKQQFVRKAQLFCCKINQLSCFLVILCAIRTKIHTSTDMKEVLLQAFSSTVRDLYALAEYAAPEQFLSQAIGLLQTWIRFDGAIFGTGGKWANPLPRACRRRIALRPWRSDPNQRNCRNPCATIRSLKDFAMRPWRHRVVASGSCIARSSMANGVKRRAGN